MQSPDFEFNSYGACDSVSPHPHNTRVHSVVICRVSAGSRDNRSRQRADPSAALKTVREINENHLIQSNHFCALPSTGWHFKSLRFGRIPWELKKYSCRLSLCVYQPQLDKLSCVTAFQRHISTEPVGIYECDQLDLSRSRVNIQCSNRVLKQL